ncbi:hypothetical protein [Polynucleobacter sp. AP-Kolm-20A-A1]|uniref:hypothetical protein n=1 Tax=Polynucleobacter sp. AP-Kolm-20A-A1 TaxID=2081041 RepID=UPI001BFDC3AE|nr:hypothetical protein [Polynucleobacter sp. AP-Kolm-20A-A1]QWE20157.1 hypothetical protein C2745_07085 [Polynucleobacter sp. AP-Kolm-20A-A1]
MMNYKKIFYVGLFLLAGCQSTPQQAFNDPGGDVGLVFFREKNFSASLKDAEVFVDGVQVCAIPNGGNCRSSTTAGKHTLKIDATFTVGYFSKSYVFESGKTYRFNISADNTQLVAGLAGGGIGYAVGGDIGGLVGVTAAEVGAYEVNKNDTSVSNGVFKMESLDN